MLREYLSSYKSLISEIQHLSDREDTMKEVECHSFADFLFSLKYLSTSADSARFFVSRKLVSFFYVAANFAYMFPFIRRIHQEVRYASSFRGILLIFA